MSATRRMLHDVIILVPYFIVFHFSLKSLKSFKNDFLHLFFPLDAGVGWWWWGGPFRTKDPNNFWTNISHGNCSHFWDIFPQNPEYVEKYLQNIFLYTEKYNEFEKRIHNNSL